MEAAFDTETDVVVVGSGAAAMSAAVSARVAGARVLLLEKTPKLGGTTAVSGGIAWVPNNAHMHEIGATDSPADALQYLRSISLGKASDELLTAFVEAAPAAARFLEDQTPLRWRVLRYPDYHPEFPGGRSGGRSLCPELYDARQLGEWQKALRMSPHVPGPVTIADVEDGIDRFDFKIIAERMQRGLVGNGVALIAPLLKACIDRGVDVRCGARVRSLVTKDGAVIGVVAEREGRPLTVRARRGVILASGGFEWNPDLCRQFLRGPLEASASPTANEGDALLMSMEIGASLDNMSEAWWMPVIHVGGEEYEGRDLFRISPRERTVPGSIMVNGAGRRFVNEAHNYSDIGRTFHDFDPVACGYPNIPAWLVFDHQAKSSYLLATVFPDDPAPAWMARADTLEAIARSVGIDPAGLAATVDRFNAHAARGVDPDFHRGESVYDRYNGDGAREGALATLRPLTKPPFYALRIHAGALGTKGGPRTNARAQVLDVRGAVIPGLYAAGNAMACVQGYGGAGGTIGPALTFGYLAGRTAASDTTRT